MAACKPLRCQYSWGNGVRFFWAFVLPTQNKTKHNNNDSNKPYQTARVLSLFYPVRSQPVTPGLNPMAHSLLTLEALQYGAKELKPSLINTKMASVFLVLIYVAWRTKDIENSDVRVCILRDSVSYSLKIFQQIISHGLRIFAGLV